MGRRVIERLAGVLLLLAPACWASVELVAVVDLRFLKETEQAVVLMCPGGTNDECYPTAYGYLFEARLRKVIHGEPPASKKFLVLYGRNGLKERDIAGISGRFSKLTDGTAGAEYQLIERAVDGRLTCFEWRGLEGKGPAELPRSGFLLRCFDREKPAEARVEDSPLRDPVQTLRAANAAYNQALVSGDIPTLEQFLADEFVYTTPGGEVLDRASVLGMFRSNALDVTRSSGSDETFQVHGRTGIVVGRSEASGTYSGTSFNSSERFTAVWLVRDDRWQLVTEQGTHISPKN